VAPWAAHGVGHDMSPAVGSLRRLPVARRGVTHMAHMSRRSAGAGSAPCYPAGMSIWLGIFIGSTIGGFIPELWHAGAFSYTSVLFSGIGALAGLWVGFKLGN
jgi:hypothetical protein